MGNDLLDWFFDHVAPWLFLLAIALVAVGIPAYLYAAYQESKQPHISLLKSKWACTDMQRTPITTYVKSGNVMVPMTTYANECHQWSRQP